MLWKMYLKEFGPSAKRITWNSGRFSGKFFEFCWDIAQLVGLKRTRDALGRAIMAAQSKADTRPSESKGVSYVVIETRDESGDVERQIAGDPAFVRSRYAGSRRNEKEKRK
jgi:hypothetical protein